MVFETATTFPNNSVKMAVNVDDFTAEESFKNLKRCWDTFCNLDHKFDYCLDSKKSWLVIKGDFKEKSK